MTRFSFSAALPNGEAAFSVPDSSAKREWCRPLAIPTEAAKWLDTAPPVEANNRSLVVFDRGDEMTMQAGNDGIGFLLVSGKPLDEPVAWYGPIVMNTRSNSGRHSPNSRRGRS
jgi:hypothetical protein